MLFIKLNDLSYFNVEMIEEVILVLFEIHKELIHSPFLQSQLTLSLSQFILEFL